jgi:protein-L-isoaspartate(D-aspartate) O-methyltransferase
MRCLLAVVAALSFGACKSRDDPPPPKREVPKPRAPRPADPYLGERERMVDRTIVDRGVVDPRVIEAMRSVPRHEFVPPEIRDQAYSDRPLPIGFGLTISQAFIVATMTEAVQLHAGDRVLEIGTGSGYQAAVLAEMSADVYTIELHDQLAQRTLDNFRRLGLDEIHLRTGDGFFGWPEAAPFDAIIVTCAAPEVPAPLLEQLAAGGRLVIPLGEDEQQLQVLTKAGGETTTRALMDVRFGPMLGEVRKVR